jgi:ABC-type multidrug transport system ATPase subunit
LLVLDEPVVGLDPPSQAILKDILLVAKEQHGAILLATHQLPFARGLADRAVILAEGRIASDGPFDRVMAGEMAATLGLE